MEKVSIIIPSWKGERYLKECLGSLKNIDYENYSIVLVDNGSIDESVTMVERNFPEVFIIKNKKNLGFACAINQGIKFALKDNSDFMLLLNNDTVVRSDFLKKMVMVAKSGKRIGIVGCKIYYYTEPKRIWFAGGDFIKWRISGKHRYWAIDEKNILKGIHDSDFITGCCCLIKSEVFKDVGNFYEPYFLGVEDLDFCYQAKKAGWEIKVNLDAVIYHKVSLSRDGEFSFSNGYYGTRNRLYFAFRRSKNYFGGLIFLLIICPIRILQWTWQGKKSMRQGLIIGIKDFLKNKMGNY